MMTLQQQANRIGTIFFEKVTDKRQIAKRLAHLLAILVDHACMHPKATEWYFACRMLRLHKLTCMMREGQISTTTVNINLLPQEMHSHRATFDMPTWATGSPRTIPRRFTGSLGLPEHKV